MKKGIKKLLISLGLGAMFIFGTTAAVSASSDAVLERYDEPQAASEIVLNDESNVPAAYVGHPTKAVQTAATTTTFTLQWNSVSDAERYKIYIGPYNATDSDKFRYLGSTTRTSCTVKNLDPGVPYTVRILAATSTENAKYYLRRNCVTLHNTIAIKKVTPSKDVFTFFMDTKSKYNLVSGYRVTYTNCATGKSLTRYYKGKSLFSVKPQADIFYRVTVRPYITLNEKKYMCPATAMKYIARQPQLSKKGSTSSTFTMGWNKVAGATSYSVYVQYPGSNSYKKVKTTRYTSYKLSGLKQGLTYRVKVIANRKSVHSANTYYFPIKL